MRYYEIVITNPKTGEIVRPKNAASLKLPYTYGSFVNGQTNPNALDIEVQLNVAPQHVPIQGSFVRIWGVSLEEISQANNLYSFNITVKVGMKKGLPLANPKFAGVAITGTIWQCFGNWENLDKTLDIFMIGGAITPANFQFNWPKNSQLADAIKTTLSSALPDLQQKVAISDKLVTGGAQQAIYSNVRDFATAINKTSLLPQFAGIKPLGGGKYQGVKIEIKDNTVIVSDGTQQIGDNSVDNPKVIEFVDLIGQPTWIGPNKINFKTVMRADLQPGDVVKLPNLKSPYVLTQGGAGIPGGGSTNPLAFKGSFVILQQYYFGRFRSPNASAWVTSFDAAFLDNAPTQSDNNSIVQQAFNAPTGTTVTSNSGVGGLGGG